MVLTAIALVIVWFIFNQIVAGIAAGILLVMIIASGFLLRQAFMKMDSYVDGLVVILQQVVIRRLNTYRSG